MPSGLNFWKHVQVILWTICRGNCKSKDSPKTTP